MRRPRRSSGSVAVAISVTMWLAAPAVRAEDPDVTAAWALESEHRDEDAAEAWAKIARTRQDPLATFMAVSAWLRVQEQKSVAGPLCASQELLLEASAIDRDRDELRRLAAEVERRLHHLRATCSAPHPEGVATRAASVEAPAAGSIASSPTVSEESAPPRSQLRLRGGVGVGVGAALAAGSLAALAHNLWVARKLDDYAALARAMDLTAAQEDAAVHLRRQGWASIGLAAGLGAGALAATGVGLWMLIRDRREMERRCIVAPLAGASEAGMAVVGRF